MEINKSVGQRMSGRREVVREHIRAYRADEYIVSDRKGSDV